MTDEIVVAIVQGPSEEANVRAFLDANGIASRTRTQVVHDVYAITVDGLGASAILVRSDQADEARGLLAEADRGGLRLPADEDAV